MNIQQCKFHWCTRIIPLKDSSHCSLVGVGNWWGNHCIYQKKEKKETGHYGVSNEPFWPTKYSLVMYFPLAYSKKSTKNLNEKWKPEHYRIMLEEFGIIGQNVWPKTYLFIWIVWILQKTCHNTSGCEILTLSRFAYSCNHFKNLLMSNIESL